MRSLLDDPHSVPETAAQSADLNVALTNSDIASPDTIGLRGNDKISKINRKAVSGADRCLCLDVGGVHGNPRSEIRTSSIAAVGPAFALRSSGCV